MEKDNYRETTGEDNENLNNNGELESSQENEDDFERGHSEIFDAAKTIRDSLNSHKLSAVDMAKSAKDILNSQKTLSEIAKGPLDKFNSHKEMLAAATAGANSLKGQRTLLDAIKAPQNINDYKSLFDATRASHEAIKGYKTLLDIAKATQSTLNSNASILSAAREAQNNLNSFKGIYSAFSAEENKLKSYSSIFNAASSTVQNIFSKDWASLQSRSIFDSNTIVGRALSIQANFESHAALFEKQLSVSEMLTKQYFNANKLEIPSWVNEITQVGKAFKESNLSMLGVLSAETFNRIKVSFEDGKSSDAEKDIDQLTALLNENAVLKAELENLYIAFSKRIASKLKRRKRLKAKDLKEPKEEFAEFIHKFLFKNNKLSLQAVFRFVCILEWLFTTIFISMILEAKGDDMFYSIFGKDSKQTDQPASNTINNNTVNNYGITNNYHNVITDFTIENANLYLRNSTKSRCVGKIKINTTALILRQKPQWCFVEVMITVYNKKLKNSAEKVVRGWVMKKHLDYFQ